MSLQFLYLRQPVCQTVFLACIVMMGHAIQKETNAQQPLCVIDEIQPATGWVAANPNSPFVQTTLYAPGNTIRANGEWRMTNNWVNPVTGCWDLDLYRCFVAPNGTVTCTLVDYCLRLSGLGPYGGFLSEFLEVQHDVPSTESGNFYYRADFAVYFVWWDANYVDPETGQKGRYVTLGPPLAESMARKITFHQPGYGGPGGQ